MILPLFLKTIPLEKVKREALTAVELLNFVRFGINISCLVPCFAHYPLHLLIFFFIS